MKSFTLVALSLFIIVVQSGSRLVHSEDSAWSWGPFSSSTKTTDAGTAKAKPGLWAPAFKVPDIAGGIQKTGRTVSSQTTAAWNSTTRATKKAWKKTTEILDPFPESPTPTLNPSPWAAGGSNSSSKPSKPKSDSSSGGMFSWFGSKETEIEKPATPQDFLRQDRP